jgi:hypothetical protein
MQEYEDCEQQVRVTKSAEVEPAMREHDDLLARQAAVASKLDLEALIKQMVTEAERMDTAESEGIELVSNDGGWSQAALAAKLDAYKHKRKAYHEADIQAKAASQLLR